ncbi:MAG: RagB/SusD family nutrient uptake outer membrane protein [Cytophagales bacterium]|nr:RagB/SusD family nutrient uptake outer membrane protein [Cytophagales bacterium]
MVDAYDFIDGTNGEIDWDNAKGSLSDLLKNKDPRLHASLYFQGNAYPGALEADSIKTYIIYGDPEGDGNYEYLDKAPQAWTNWGDLNGDGEDDFFQNCGKNSVPVAVDGAYTGFFIRKFIKDDEVRANQWQCSTDWYEYRLGEILLNQAEAAFELGQTGVALSAVNKIRERAGVALHTGIDMEKIRKERRIELAFEAHRIWDVRRWRIAESELSQVIYGIQVIWKLPDNEYSYIKYGADTRQNDGYNGTTPRYLPIECIIYPLARI